MGRFDGRTLTRSNDLLLEAAATLEGMSDPFHISFLQEHNVTSSECMQLSDDLALGARVLYELRTATQYRGVFAMLLAEVVHEMRSE